MKVALTRHQVELIQKRQAAVAQLTKASEAAAQAQQIAAEAVTDILTGIALDNGMDEDAKLTQFEISKEGTQSFITLTVTEQPKPTTTEAG